jgi:hypothetical protein
MKKQGLALFLFLFHAFLKIALSEPTGGVNGRFWHTLSSTSKLYFLYGFDEAMGLAKPYDDKLYFANVSYGDIVKGLDRFYQEPENLMFPISYALRISPSR